MLSWAVLDLATAAAGVVVVVIVGVHRRTGEGAVVGLGSAKLSSGSRSRQHASVLSSDVCVAGG